MRSALYSLVLSLLLLGMATTLVLGSALPSAGLVARSPHPSPYPILEARAPSPSSYLTKRGPREKRKQTLLSPQEQLNRKLCPQGMAVCPILPQSAALRMSAPMSTTLMKWMEEGYECTDFEDFFSCGGCGTVDIKHDCTMIPNALGVSCEQGSCRVYSCKSGFHLADDGKTCVRSH
ncbi:hypothetical protein EIP91_005644 [Steccherinum ochraceum]|uniref:Protein CPL1-like domain-containing protein n=1 Tax=Steccherinum ochraceum TaxID=92696 RepID=A0A4R0R9Q2_9APHY|nr:hypothetical protein EIP91_005644 [Steccherinum ochraceum]